GARPDYEVALSANVPRKVQTRHPLRRVIVEHSLGNLTRRRPQNSIRLAVIPIDEEPLLRIVRRRIEQNSEALSFEIVRQICDPQSIFEREIRLHLPAVLSVELVVVITEVVDRSIRPHSHLDRMSCIKIAKVVSCTGRLTPLCDLDVDVRV